MFGLTGGHVDKKKKKCHSKGTNCHLLLPTLDVTCNEMVMFVVPTLFDCRMKSSAPEDDYNSVFCLFQRG